MSTKRARSKKRDELRKEYDISKLEHPVRGKHSARASKGTKPIAPREGLRRSYRFDYSKAKPNRFARALPKDIVMVVLDPDVAAVFRTSRSVNTALRAAMSARTPRKKRDPRAR